MTRGEEEENEREREGATVLHGPTGTERTAPSVRDPRGRGGRVREGATGGGGKIAGEGRHVWGVQQFCEEVCPGFLKLSWVFRKFLCFCKIKTTHLEMVKNHETF
jgi:hypothetical protein